MTVSKLPRPTVRALVQQVLDDTTFTEPAEIAELVADMITPAAREDAVAEMLPTYIRTQFSQQRLLPATDAAPARTPSNKSSKVAAVRDQWERRNQTPINVAGVWKRLGDCTADDLLTVAADLRSRAQRNLAKADYYEGLAAILPAGGTVSDLNKAA